MKNIIKYIIAGCFLFTLFLSLFICSFVLISKIQKSVSFQEGVLISFGLGIFVATVLGIITILISQILGESK
jgi:hypothetical protein